MAKKRKLNSRFPDAPGAAARNNKKHKARPTGGAPPKSSAPNPGPQGKQRKQYHQNQEPVIPFSADDNILLIGEGDLSYAASLAAHHGCRSLTATVLEKSEAELLEKYPHAGENIQKILHPEKFAAGKSALHGDSAEQRGDDKSGDEPGSEDDEGDAGEPSDEDEDDDHQFSDPEGAAAADNKHSDTISPNRNRVLYSTDATTLKTFLTKPQRPSHPVKMPPPRTGIFNHIIFNFPHVGGKSTDVNRQVRHNQSLLVAFFERALPSLRPGPEASIIVTLFEGEPYTLWNVRDLARHAGLAVETSFRFPWASYPGYHHARTLGVVKAGGEESKTAWKGEDRPSRSYVFKRKDDIGTAAKKTKKKGADSDSDSD